MANSISKIKIPSGTVYEVKDDTSRGGITDLRSKIDNLNSVVGASIERREGSATSTYGGTVTILSGIRLKANGVYKMTATLNRSISDQPAVVELKKADGTVYQSITIPVGETTTESAMFGNIGNTDLENCYVTFRNPSGLVNSLTCTVVIDTAVAKPVDNISKKLDKPSTEGTAGQVVASDGNGGTEWVNMVQVTADVTDLPEGSPATVTSELVSGAPKLTFGIPAGATGATGAKGDRGDTVIIATKYEDLTYPVYAGKTYCYYDNKPYVAKVDIATTEAWTAAHWDEVSFENEITELKSAIEYSSKVIESAVISNSGEIVTGIWNVYCYKVPPSGTIDKIQLGSDSQQIVYGWFADEPSLNSVTVTGTRIITPSNVLTIDNLVVPSNANWIGIRVAKTDTPVFNLTFFGNVSKAMLNNKSVYSFTDANNISDTSIYYISKNGVPNNYPPTNNPVYIQTIIFNNTNKLQIATDAVTGIPYVRVDVNSAWTSWSRISADLVSALEAVAIKQISSTGITDANDITDNCFSYLSGNAIAHLPSIGAAWYLITIKFNDSNLLQLAYNAVGTQPYIRAKVLGNWSDWQMIGKEAATAELDNAVATSTIALFPNVGCCGDSFTAGYLYNREGTDWYDPNYVPNGEYPAIGYPAVMGRLYGINATAYAKGGLTTTTWRTDAAGLPALLADDPQNLYIICLGLNDRTQQVPIGVEADIDTEPATPTYLGNMGAIIRAIQAHAPLSKIILCKSPWVYSEGGSTANVYYNYSSSAIELLSSHLGIPYLETLNDAYFCSDKYVNGFKGLHPTAPLYAGMGKRIGELVGKCIYDNPQYFYNFYVPNT